VTAAVLLCAGGSTRFAGATPKLLAGFRGRPLVTWAIDHVLGAGLEETFVVAGAVDLAHLVPAGATLVENPAWEAGQATSLQAGIAAAQARGHDVVVVGLGDQPLVPAAAWSAVAAADSPIAVAVFGGHRAPPTRLAQSVWPLLPVDGDAGARLLMARRPDLVLEVACPGAAVDIDTTDDLAHFDEPPA
jgi:molybdenum cofactor cytidylyltransferase